MNIIISAFLIVACAWNYFMAVYSSPGNPPTYRELQMSDEDFEKLKNGEIIKLKNCEFQYCKYCMFSYAFNSFFLLLIK